MDDPGHDLATFPALLRNRRILLCSESFGPVKRSLAHDLDDSKLPKISRGSGIRRRSV